MVEVSAGTADVKMFDLYHWVDPEHLKVEGSKRLSPFSGLSLSLPLSPISFPLSYLPRLHPHLHQEGDYEITFEGPVRMNRTREWRNTDKRTVRVTASAKFHVSPIDVPALTLRAKELVGRDIDRRQRQAEGKQNRDEQYRQKEEKEKPFFFVFPHSLSE
jgi:hypothetical protein